MTGRVNRSRVVRAVADTTPPGTHLPLRVAYTPREIATVVDAVLAELAVQGLSLDPDGNPLHGAREVDREEHALFDGRCADLVMWEARDRVTPESYTVRHWVWDGTEPGTS